MPAATQLNRYFYAFVGIAFLNAFVDLGHKIVVQNVLFHTTDGAWQVILTNLVNAMILIPYVVLFTPAAWLSDRFAKPTVIRYASALAIVITVLITFCYAMGWFWAAFSLTLALAVQSAFYSPAKYGVIREIVGSALLGRANGWVQSATTISILLATMSFSFLFEWRIEGVAKEQSTLIKTLVPLGLVLIAGSVVEFVLACQLPKLPAIAPKQWDWQAYRSGRMLKANLSSVWGIPVIWLCIIGLAIFWAVCQVLLAVFPAHAEDSLGMNNTFHIQALMACTAIGIATGSALAGSSKRHIETGFIPLGALLVAFCVLLMPRLTSTTGLVLNFLALGIASGLYLVPLNALMQYHAPEGASGKVIASNNLIANVVMLSALGISAALSGLGMTATAQISVLFLVVLGGAIYTVYRLPQCLLRIVLGGLFGFRYRLSVGGLANLPNEGGVLLLGNHMSFIDWALLQMACPRNIRFVMHRKFFKWPVLNQVFRLCGAVPIAEGDYKQSLRRVKQMLEEGEVVCLFPEGSITASGNLLTFKRGFEQAVRGTGAAIVPFYLGGLWGSDMTRTTRLKPQGFGRRPLQVQFGAVMPDSAIAPEVKQAVMETGQLSWQMRADQQQPLGWHLLHALRRAGRTTVLVDKLSGPLSGLRMGAGVVRFAWWLKRHDADKRIGIFLPPGAGSALLNVAAWLAGREVVNLNYSASAQMVLETAQAAGLNRIYTADRFLERLQLKGFDVEALKNGQELVELAELRTSFSKASLLLSMMTFLTLPKSWLLRLMGGNISIDQCAAILFSSGSEGKPKGIMLSHRSIWANAEQVVCLLQPQTNDGILAALPHFHAFGLTATLVMPLSEGITIVCESDPTDVLSIAKAVEQHKVTLLVLTGTLLRLMNRNPKVKPEMLQSLRLTIAGAEKLQNEVRTNYADKFGHAIYEGYGATEMAPVVTVNLPDREVPGTKHVVQGNRIGTVGLPLPGTAVRVVDPETLEPLPVGEGGLVLTSGPQQMMGYLDDPDRTESVMIEKDSQRWYKTGDKGSLDEDGYLTLIDRYARFAKLGGEMISLSAVEQALTDCVEEEVKFVVVAIQDTAKGEKLIAWHDGELDMTALRDRWKASNASALMWPGQFKQIEEIPVLGVGKVDYQQLKKLVAG